MLESLAIQNLLVGAIVAFAAVLLILRASKYILSGKSSAGSSCSTGCTNCPSNAQQPKLLQLGSQQLDR